MHHKLALSEKAPPGLPGGEVKKTINCKIEEIVKTNNLPVLAPFPLGEGLGMGLIFKI
jgi:hypothetical protein